MSTPPIKKENKISDIIKRSEEEILEEAIKNQQTIDIYIQTEQNWN